MHPIERLRYVARAGGVDPSVLVRETATAMAAVAHEDPVGMVPACRRLIQRHLTTGPMWWLVANVLTAGDPVAAAWTAADEIDNDDTAEQLARALPDDATITIVGWPAQVAAGLRRRGDVEVLVVDCAGDGHALVRRLEGMGVDAVSVSESGLGAAVAVSDLVVVEVLAAGPPALVATSGSHAAAAVARTSAIPVWAVAGVGRILPERMWQALTTRLDELGEEPWERVEEVVPTELVDFVVGPGGMEEAATAFVRPTCPVAPELLRAAG